MSHRRAELRQEDIAPVPRAIGDVVFRLGPMTARRCWIYLQLQQVRAAALEDVLRPRCATYTQR